MKNMGFLRQFISWRGFVDQNSSRGKTHTLTGQSQCNTNFDIFIEKKLCQGFYLTGNQEAVSGQVKESKTMKSFTCALATAAWIFGSSVVVNANNDPDSQPYILRDGSTYIHDQNTIDASEHVAKFAAGYQESQMTMVGF